MTQILIRKLSKEKEISVSYLVMIKTWCSKLRCWYLVLLTGFLARLEVLFLTQWDAELDLLMVPNGELHIAAVDYSHTHHPYFCIVKHR